MTKIKSFFLIFIIILITLFISSYNSLQKEIKLLQINAQWNRKNDINLNHLPSFYKNIEIEKSFALLEHQTQELKSSIKAVPVIILLVDGKLKYQWTANLSFQLNITKDEVKNALSKILN